MPRIKAGPDRLLPSPGQDLPNAEALRYRRWTRLLPLAAILLPLVMVVGGGWLSWRAAWQDAAHELAQLSATSAEYAARSLEGYSLAAARMNDRLRGLSDAQIRADEPALHQELQGIVADVSQGDVGYVIDGQGIALLATNQLPAPRGQSLVDRDYFQALAGPDAPPVFLSAPFVGRFDGRLVFAVSRPRRDTGNASAGVFDGLTTVSVNPNVLARGLLRVAAVSEGEIALVRADGLIFSRTTLMEAPLPPVPAGHPFHAAVRGTEPSVFRWPADGLLGQASLVAMTAVEDFPAYAVAIRPQSHIVETWWRRLASHLLFGIPATLALFALSLRVARDQARLADANLGLERDVNRSSDRLDRAHRLGKIGTFEFWPTTGANIRSSEYMAIHGIAQRETGESHDDWVRRLHPDDREAAEAEVAAALADPTVREYSQMYRIVRPAGDLRWVSATGLIERDAHGRAVLLRGAHVDVTPLRTTELALAESDAWLRLAQEAVGIGTWEWVRKTGKVTWSRAMLRLWGFDANGGQPDTSQVLERMLPEDRHRFRREMAAAVQTGRLRSEVRILRPIAGGGEELVWIVTRARLLPTPGHAQSRFLGIAYDATERKRVEERAVLLAHEVEHRAKNALTIVSSLLRMTRADSAEEFAEVMDGRVKALAGALTLLGQQRWKGALLGQLVDFELVPFGAAISDNGFDISAAGPEVLLRVEAAQAVSMALHELATNAAKYGALSAAGGRLAVHWRVEGGVVHLHWAETGGPPLAGPPARESFGTQLITSIFETQLGGQITRRWETTGLVCAISFPADAGDPPAA